MSHSAVLAALGKLGITAHGGRNGHAVKGQVPYGWGFLDCRLVRKDAEQQVIRRTRELQGGGESLHGNTREPNRRLVPTKNAGLEPTPGERYTRAGGTVLRSIQIRVQPGEQSGYVADCMDLPVVSQGATIDEAMASIREAIELHLADEDPVALGISTTAPMLTTMQLEPLRA